MDTDPTQKGRTRGCLGCLAVAVILVIVAGIVFTLWQRAQSDAIQERFAARGLPTSLEELDAWYEHVPDEENAALGFMAAANRIVRTESAEEHELPLVTNRESPKYGLVLDEPTARAARGYLDKNAQALELAHAAAKLDKSRYPMNLTLGLAGLNSSHQNTAKLRDVTRHLCLEALVRTHEGDTAGAVDSFAASYATARSLSQEPVLLSQFVLIAIEGITAEHLCNALSAKPFPREDLDRIAELAAAGNVRDSYYRAIAGEAGFVLFSNLPNNAFGNPLFTFDRDAYARLIEDLLDASSLSLREIVGRTDGALKGLEYSWLGMRIHPLTSIIAPALARSSDAMIRAEVYGQMTSLVVAIEKFRLDHNALPDDLAQLVPDYLPELPQDPYSDGPYRYLLTNPGYAVYSLGPNRQDDQAAKLTGTTGDINLRVTR